MPQLFEETLRDAAEALATPGAGGFRYADDPGGGGALDVQCYRPTRYTADSPVLFVMHGKRRNASDYRDAWAPAAERYGCLVLCPLFPHVAFSRLGYQQGGVVDAEGALRPRGAWTLGVIERLFDAVREATGNRSGGYHIYGHSAGAQFVHRLALLMPEARYVAAAAANAGWYTMPTAADAFPYGLGGTELSEGELRRALGRRLVVLLGEADTDSGDPFLRNEAGTLRQGRNRFERGLAFYEAALEAAVRLNVPLGWELLPVPGAAHLDAQMMPAAARALFAPP